jgi:hypothetical protein
MALGGELRRRHNSQNGGASLRNNARQDFPHLGDADRADCRLTFMFGSAIPRLDQSRDRQVPLGLASSGSGFQLISDLGLWHAHKLRHLR